MYTNGTPLANPHSSSPIRYGNTKHNIIEVSDTEDPARAKAIDAILARRKANKEREESIREAMPYFKARWRE